QQRRPDRAGDADHRQALSGHAGAAACRFDHSLSRPSFPTGRPIPGIKSSRPGMNTSRTRAPEPAGWQAFEAEAMPHLDRLFRLAMWLERDRTEAEDVVQETLIQALQSFHRYRPGTNCRAWLTTILQHVRANRRRARARAPIVATVDEERVTTSVAFVPPVPDSLTDEDLLAALESIPPAHQEVILLCDVQEM